MNSKRSQLLSTVRNQKNGGVLAVRAKKGGTRKVSNTADPLSPTSSSMWSAPARTICGMKDNLLRIAAPCTH